MRSPKDTIEMLERELAGLKDQLKTLELTNARLVNTEGVPDERAAFYVTLLEAANDAIFLMDSKRYIDCNAKATEMFGCTKEQLVNAEPQDFSPEYQPDGKSSSLSILEKLDAALRGESLFFEWRHHKLDGTLFDVEVSLNKVRYSSMDYVLAIVRDITSRKKTEEALAKSEARFRSLVENSSDIIWETTVEGNYTYISPKVKDILGYEPIELIGKKPSTYIPESEHEKAREYYDQITKEKKPIRNFRTVSIKKDGNFVITETNGEPVFDENGELIGYRGINRDITERVRSERRFKLAARAVSDLIYEWDLKTGRLSWHGDIEGMLGCTKGETPTSIEKWPQFIHPDDKNTIEEAIGKRRRSPDSIRYEYRVMTKDGDTRLWADYSIPEVDDTGNILKWIGACQDITERKQDEQRLKLALEGARSGVWDWNVETGEIIWDQRVKEIFGVETEGYKDIFEAYRSIIHPDDLKWVDQHIREAVENESWGGSYYNEHRIIHSDGTTRWVLLNGAISRKDNGRAIRMIGVCRDITVRKLADEKLYESEERYRTLFETMAQGVIYQDANGNIISANPAAENILGYSVEQMIGQTSKDTLWKSIHEDGSEFPGESHPAMVALRTGKEVKNIVMGVYNNSAGEYKWININAVPQFKKGDIDPFQVFTTFDDITERKRYEEALRESREALARAQEIAHIGNWKIDLKTKVVTGSDELYHVYGYEPGQVELTQNFLRDNVHPDDVPHMDVVRDNLLTEIPIDFEHRIVWQDGTIKYVWGRGKTDFDDSGEPVCFVGTIMDITERKLAEEALKKSEAKYTDLYENSPDMYATIGAKTSLVEECNFTLVDTLGYTKEEIIGRPVTELYHSDCLDEVEKTFSLLVEDGDIRDKEFQLRKKDGSKLDVSLNISSVRDENGKLICSRSTMRDITERKRQRAINTSRLYLMQFAVTHTLDKLLEETLNEVEKLTDSMIGFYHFVEDNQNSLTLQEWSTRTKSEFCQAEGKGLHYDISEAGVWVECVEKREPVIHNDYALLPNRKGIPSGHAEVIRELVVPVIRGEKIKAILGVGNKSSNYTEKDVEAVSLLANLAWEIAERKMVDDALRDNEAKLREAQKMAHLGHWFWDVKTGDVKWSDEVFKIFRLDPNEFKPQIDSILALSPWPEDNQRDQELIQKAIESHEPGSYEQRFLRPDGTTGYYFSTFQGIYGINDELVSMKGTVQDITERKIAEQQILENEENLRITLDSIGDGVISTDVNGLVTRMNPVAENLTGWKLSEAFGNPLIDIFNICNGQTGEPCRNPVEKVLRDGRIVGLANDTILISKDGDRYQIADSGAPIRNSESSIVGVVMVFRNVTEKYEQQKKVRESQQQLSRLISDIPGAVYQCLNDRNWTMLFYSEGIKDLTGIPPEDFVEGRVQLNDLILPEHREQVWQNVQDAVAKKEAFELIFQITAINGEIKWLWEKGQGVYSDDGELEILEGIQLDITDAKVAQEALKKSEERYRLAQRLSGVGTWEWNLKTQGVYWSDEVIAMWGFEPAEFRESYDEVAQRVHPDDFKRWQENVRACVENGKEHNVEFRIIWPDGSIRWVAAFGDIERNESGEPLRMIGVVMDITDRKQSEEALLRSFQTSADIIREIPIGFNIYEYQEPDKLYLINTNPEAIRLTGIDIERYRNKEYNEIWPNAEKSGLTRDYLNVMHTGKTYFADDIYYEDEHIAGIYKIRAFEIPGNRLAVAFEDVTEMKIAEKTIISERDKAQQYLDIAETVLVALSDDGRITLINNKGCRLLGYSEEELLGKDWFDVAIPEYQKEQVRQVFFDIISGKLEANEYYENYVVTKDGSHRLVAWYNTYLRDSSGKILGTLSSGEDITERKMAEEALKAEKDFVSRLTETSPVGIVTLNPEGKVTFANEMTGRIIGFEKNQIIGKNYNDTEWHISDGEGNPLPDKDNPFNRVIQSKKSVLDVEVCLESDAGRTLFLMINATPLLSPEGELESVIMTINDITERKRVEKQIRESEQRFRLVTETIRDVFWLESVETKEMVYVSPEYDNIWGRSRENLLKSPEEWLENVHPNDRASLSLRHDERIAANKSYSCEYRIVLPDGGIRWIFERGFPVENETGQTEMYAGICTNITERKLAEEEIRQSKARIESILRAAPVGISLVVDRVTLSANQKLAEISGFPVDELEGQNVINLYSDRQEYEFVGRELYGEIETKGTSAIETKWKRKDGRIIDVLINASPLDPKNPNGGVTIAAMDITQRKQDEESLKKAYAEIEELKNKLEQENIYLQHEIELEHNFHEIIGNSKSLQIALHKVEQVAKTDSNVLILGETGTGKELFARAIHNLSNRRNRPLVKVNCAALPESLIESELFGHEKGAFTGAVARREGRFDLANGGTIFLDEIGDIPLELQAKLLRVLQESEFERLGGTKTIKIDVRIIAATNRDLQKVTESGKFREDLFHRLNVFPITIPPLRDRHDDIPNLAKHFVNKYSQRIGKKIDQIPRSVMTRLTKYNWPGNVRGLENVIERAVIISESNQLELGEWEAKPVEKTDTGKLSSLEEVEREHILRTLNITNWKVSGAEGAAQILKMKPTTLEARMKKLGIKRPSK